MQGPSRVTTFSTFPSLQILTGTLRILKLMDAQDDAGTVHVSLVTRGDTISVLNETGISPKTPIDVNIL